MGCQAALQIEPTPAPWRPSRQCPDDFDVIFVEKGRLECEAWYAAGRISINRWLDERGKERLIALRAAFVDSMRKQGLWITRGSDLVEHRMPRRTEPALSVVKAEPSTVPIELIRLAADHLRCVRNGGWAISQVPAADVWLVGRLLLSGDDMLAKAEGKGFDTAAVLVEERAAYRRAA